MFAWLQIRVPRLLWWLLYAAVAFHSLFFIQGLFEGAFHFASSAGWGSVAIENFSPTRTESQALHLLAELEELTVPPFGVPKITTPVKWWRRLGLFRMDPFQDTDMYRTLYNPDALLHEVRSNKRGRWHHWVYLSGTYGDQSSPSRQQKEWDNAFDELVRYHGVDPRRTLHPAANGAGFHYMSCVNNTLCRLFVARGPALLHFTTETLDGSIRGIDEGFYSLDQVSVRIIELPLRRGTVRLPPGMFPTPLSQLRSLTENPDAWRYWKPETPLERIHTRLRTHTYFKSREYKWTYGLIVKMEMLLPNFVSVNRVATSLYTAGWLTSAAARLVLQFGPGQIASLLYETFPQLAPPTWKERSAEMEKKQMEFVKEIVLIFYSCVDGHVGKIAQIPEVGRIIRRLMRLLPEETRTVIENGDPGMRRECRKDHHLGWGGKQQREDR